jgi:hypothetical protein
LAGAARAERRAPSSRVTAETSTLNSLAIAGGQVKIPFTLVSGAATNFHLLQASQIGGPWTTNASAALSTNIPGSAFQFTATNGGAMRFYRVATP